MWGQGSWGSSQQSSWGSQQGSWGKGGQQSQQSWGSGGDQWGSSTQTKGKAGAGKGAAPQKVPASSSPAAQKVPASSAPANAKGGAWGASGKGAAWGKSAAPAVDKGAEFKAKVAKFAKEFETIEKVAKTTLESTKVVLENEKATAGALKSSMESAEKQQTKLNELMKNMTGESYEGRKLGAAHAAPTKELMDMITKIKTLWQSAATTTSKLRPRAAKAQAEADLKVKEGKDTAAFTSLFSKLKAGCLSAENAANDVAKKAAPLVSSPPEDGAEKDKKVAAIETAATEALKKLDAAKADIGEKMKTIASYAPEAKKTAQASLMEMQKKVNEAVKTVTVYKSFKVQLPKLAANEKTISEISEKLKGHDGAISKAGELAKASSMTKEKLGQIEEQVDPVQKAISEVGISLSKLRGLDAVTQDKATKLRARGDELKKKVEGVFSKIKGQRDKIKAEENIETAKELAEKCDSCWKACQEAEMPFLMGVEVLPKEENEEALKNCKEASTAAAVAANAARSHCRVKLAEAKAYEKDLSASTITELTKLMKEIEANEVKFSKFAKDLAERRILPLITEALDALDEFEKKVKIAESAGKVLLSPSIETETAEVVDGAVEKLKSVLSEANASGNKAKNTLQKNQRDSHARDNHPSVVQIKKGLTDGNEKLSKLRSALTKGEQIVRAQKALTSGEEKVKEAEEAAAKAKKCVPKAGKAFSMDAVSKLKEACAEAMKSTKLASSAISPAMTGAPSQVKAELQKLLDRNTAAKKEIDEIQSSTKEPREEALSSHYVEEGKEKVKAVEDAAQKMDDAEGPFLIGSSMGSSKATFEVLEKCSQAAKEVQVAISAYNTLQSQKIGESRQFAAEMSKKVKEIFAELAAKVKKVSDKLVTFEKDSRERSKEARMVEVGEKEKELEANAKKTLSAVEVFTKEGADKMSEAEAEAPLKAFMEAEKETSKIIQSLTGFLQARAKEQQGNKEHTETIKKVQERIKEIKDEITEKRKSVTPHEKRSLGTRLLAEAKEQVAGLDAEIKKATGACAPLLEEAGLQFLVAASVSSLAAALQKHMQEKSLSIDEVFKSIKKGKALGDKDFSKFLSDLAASGHDELGALSEGRPEAMVKKIASSSKGISAEDFANILKQECTCTKQVTLTDKFEIEGGETLCKVEPGTTVELLGASKDDEKGLTRSECKVGDKTGWITVKQGKGVRYLTIVSPFKVFCAGMDKAVQEGGSAVQKVSSSLSGKLKQGGPAEEGPLKEARTQMEKLKEDVTAAIKAIEELKKKVGEAKRAYATKEAAERNAHIEAKNKKEAAPFLEAPNAKVEALEAEVKAVEEAAAPMVSLSGDGLQSFATPASVAEKVDKLAAAVKESADAAREAIKEQTKAASEISPPTGGIALAKSTLKGLSAKVDKLAGEARKAQGVVSGKCKSLTAAKLEPVADALRKLAAKKGKSIEEFFDSRKKGEKIPEAAFCKTLESLVVDEVPISSELAKLVCRKLEADGISKDTFMKYVVLYFKVVRTIVFTDALDISNTKTLRKGDEGEVVEVLEGPVTDEANGLTRVRAKSLKKDDTTVGWITVSGSKGTAFLERTTKPVEKKPVEKAAAKPAETAKPAA